MSTPSAAPALATFEAADGILGIDTRTAGLEQFNSVYLMTGAEPTLVESASAADADALGEALEGLGVGPSDLAHVVLTHVHLDHAGGVGPLFHRFPRASVWVHERGAPHLVDPSRLLASTSRTYGAERMRALYGDTVPVDAARVHAVTDGDRIVLGPRRLEVLHTPGHASHHIALHEPDSGAVFTGEAIGSHLPWADAYRPALPPPEVEVQQALASIERIRALAPRILLTSHFGTVVEPQAGCERAAERVRSWSDAVAGALIARPDADADDLAQVLTELAMREFRADAGRPIDLERYDAIGSIRMNATGLARYWRKRWEREAESGAEP